MREGEFTTEKTRIEIHDKNVRYCQGITGGGFSFRGLARWGRLGGLSLSLVLNGAKAYAFGLPPILSRCSPLDGGAFALLDIVRLLCKLPRVIIADA